MTPVESGDRWVLPLAGRGVERLCIDFAVTLVFGGGVELRIEQPFVLQGAEGSETLVVPEGDPDRLAPPRTTRNHCRGLLPRLPSGSQSRRERPDGRLDDRPRLRDGWAIESADLRLRRGAPARVGAFYRDITVPGHEASCFATNTVRRTWRRRLGHRTSTLLGY